MGKTHCISQACELSLSEDGLAQAMMSEDREQVRNLAEAFGKAIIYAELGFPASCCVVALVFLRILKHLHMNEIDPTGFSTRKERMEADIGSSQAEGLPALVTRWAFDILDWLKAAHADKAQRLVQSCIHLIETRFREPLSVDSLSSELGYSTGHVRRAVKAITVSSILQILNRRRVLEAVSLIKKGAPCLKEVAYDVGFRSYDAFAYNFIKYVGTPPLKFQHTWAKKSGALAKARKPAPHVGNGRILFSAFPQDFS